MPYLLYVLKTGFADAGYELVGDILTDEDFSQQVLYSNIPYYLTTAQQEHILTAVAPTYEFPTAGTWRLVCDNQHISGTAVLRLKFVSLILNVAIRWVLLNSSLLIPLCKPSLWK